MTLLVLGGTSEGRQLAEALAAQGRDFILSLSGATRSPAQTSGRRRVGGFGGRDGFAAYLKAESIDAIIDATHPFAAYMSVRSHGVAAELGLPYLQILRPEWVPGARDCWIAIASESEAADFIAPGQTAFLATGRQTLHRFANLTHAKLICRQIDPPVGPFPFANGAFLVGRPPFSVAHERALFQKLEIDWLVVKNAGGAASATKLTAARELKVPVLMLRRPEPPDCARVSDVAGALRWLGKM